MTWAKFEPGWTRNLKLRQTSNLAFRIFHEMIDYSVTALSDGVVPKADWDSRKERAASGELLKITSIHDAAGYAACPSTHCQDAPAPSESQWAIHDFLRYQQSRVEVEREKELARDRQRRRRLGNEDVTAKSRRSHGEPPPFVTDPERTNDRTTEDPGSSSLASSSVVPGEQAGDFNTETPEGVPEIGQLSDVLSDSEAHFLREIVRRNAGFSKLSVAHVGRLKDTTPEAFRLALVQIRTAEPGVLEAVEKPAAYLDQAVSRIESERIRTENASEKVAE